LPFALGFACCVFFTALVFRCAFGLLMLTVNYVLIVIKGLSLLTRRIKPWGGGDMEEFMVGGRIFPAYECMSVLVSRVYANNKIQLG